MTSSTPCQRSMRWPVLLVIASLLLAATGGAAGAPSSGEPSGDIVLYAYSGIFQDNYTKPVIEPFMRKYPKITVRLEAPGNSAQMLARLRAQRNDPQADVVIMDVSIAAQGDGRGHDRCPRRPGCPGHHAPSVSRA